MDLDQDTLTKVLCGPRSVSSVVSDIHKVIEHKKVEVIKRQAEIATLVVIAKTLSSLREAWLSGGPPAVAEPSPFDVMKETAAKNEQAHKDFETQAAMRLESRMCTFKYAKKDGGHWCQRPLSTDEECEAGYCGECMLKMKRPEDA